jgi:hypothetical protein
MRSQEHQKIRENATNKSTKYRSRGGQHGSEKGDVKGLTEDTAVLPESSQGNQKRVSEGRSSDVVQEC